MTMRHTQLIFFASILSVSLTFANINGIKLLAKHQRKITFKCFTLGPTIDVIESVFDVCDEKETEEGLTLSEVKESHCMNHLTTVLGMLEENIAKDFEAIDENGDGLVSKQESFQAYQNLAMDRKDDNETPPPDLPNPWFWFSDLSSKVSKTVRETILNFATNNRKTYGKHLEYSEYTSFMADLSKDLEKEFGGKWSCVSVEQGDQWASIIYKNNFYFIIANLDVQLHCWIQKQCD